MAPNEKSVDLMLALAAHEGLKRHGFTAACGQAGGVVVDRRSHVRGVWYFAFDCYFWIPAGYAGPTFRCHTVDGAIEHTVAALTQG